MAMVWYEIKKILVRPSCQITLAILLILAGQSCYRVLYGSEAVAWVNEAGIRETGYAAAQKLRTAQKKWSGTLNQELLETALTELKQISAEAEKHPEDPDYSYKKFQGLIPIRYMLNHAFKEGYAWKYETYFVAENVEPEQLPAFYDNRIKQLKDWLYNESSTGYARFSEKEKQYLVQNYESLETPFQVGYTEGWECAFNAGYYVILYGTILLAVLISGIFANEFRWKADSVYFSTQLGRTQGTAAKLAAGFLFTTVVYWVLLLAINLFVLCFLGFDGGACPVQATFRYWNSIHHITFFQRSILQLLDGYLLWLFIAGMVMLVSAISGSLSLSVSIPGLLILGTNLLDTRGYIGESSKLLSLFPHKMVSSYGNEAIVLYSVLGEIVSPITIQRILYSCLTILMLLACYQVYRRKQLR